MSNGRPPFLRLRSLCAVLGWSMAAATLPAQIAVTAVDYGTTTNGTDRTAGNITYLNQTTQVEYISTALGTYNFNGPLASAVYFRRNTSSGNPNNSTVFYQYSSTGSGSATVLGKGDSSPTMSEVMLSNDLTQGLRNPFANSSASTSSNIERIDFYFSGGYTVQAGDAMVFFDLENVGNYGDGFRVAAFTSVGTVNGASNAPTAYANSGLLVQPGTFGNPVDTPTGTNARYLRATTTNGDNLASGQSITTLDTNAGSPNSSDLYLVGTLIRFTDLGLSVGQTIYGYSLMAGDVSANSASDLVNWNNSSVYLTNTDPNSWGNMDFMGFGAQISRPVPEPSTYGALFIGASLALFGLRRWRALRNA
ncbi:MAG TPA: PEP-CTERM sorting domain-containing protein [Acidobacteriota bacterium]|nr:PEP-CTERM sorting domain-containing protein [Acidobacteriota bacterium]